MTMRIAPAVIVFGVLAGTAWSQEPTTNDVQQGHRLANLICSNCHVASSDQQFAPILRPPAPSFESIAQREATSADSVRKFLTTTHRDLSNPEGMPNPELLDFQVRQVAAYLMSLRTQSTTQRATDPGTQGGLCSAEIARLEKVLSEARANRQVAGSAAESVAARRHRQPTPTTVAQAETDADRNLETALAIARKLSSDGDDSQCVATLKKVALPLGVR
jgi:cytochrome c